MCYVRTYITHENMILIKIDVTDENVIMSDLRLHTKMCNVQKYVTHEYEMFSIRTYVTYENVMCLSTYVTREKMSCVESL